MKNCCDNQKSIRFYCLAACTAATLALGLATTAMADALHGVLCGLVLSIAALIAQCCLYAHADLYTRTRCKDMLWQSVALCGLFLVQFFVYDLGRCPVYTVGKWGETYAGAGLFSLLLQCLYLVALCLLLVRVLLNVFGKTLYPFEKRLAEADIENIECRTSKADTPRHTDVARLLEQADSVMAAEKPDIKEETGNALDTARDFISPEQARRDKQQRLLQAQDERPAAADEPAEENVVPVATADTAAENDEQRLQDEALSIIGQDDMAAPATNRPTDDTVLDDASVADDVAAANVVADMDDHVIYADSAIENIDVPILGQTDDMEPTDCDLRSEVVVHHTKQTKHDKDDALYTDFLYGDTEETNE